MNHKTLILSLLAVTALAVACKPSDDTSTQQQFDKVKLETKDASQNMKDYTYAQKNEFVSTMQTQLAAINRDLDQLSAKIEKSNDAAKAEAKPKLQALRDKADVLGKQLDQAKDATESTWDSVKAGSKKAYDELKDGFNQARQWVSDKIAP
ncbi:MAG: hypothetical protein JWQ04_2913 [Pedosphaera sp.]|nr:hypothetical protein [Pedosphaera sp.]